MERYRAITSAENTLKMIIICSIFFKEFSSPYYNDKGEVFGFLFREYIKQSLQKINNT